MKVEVTLTPDDLKDAIKEKDSQSNWQYYRIDHKSGIRIILAKHPDEVLFRLMAIDVMTYTRDDLEPYIKHEASVQLSSDNIILKSVDFAIV